MAGSLNKILLIGNVGKDPEVKTTNKGEFVATFSMATSYSYQPNGSAERVEQTEWHRVVAWRRLAETAAKYITRGRKVYVEGRLQSRKYTGNDGQERTVYEIVANEITFLDNPKDAQPRAEEAPVGRQSFVKSNDFRTCGSEFSSFEDLDDIPF